MLFLLKKKFKIPKCSYKSSHTIRKNVRIANVMFTLKGKIANQKCKLNKDEAKIIKNIFMIADIKMNKIANKTNKNVYFPLI